MENNNLRALNLEQTLKHDITNSDLSVSVIYYILKTILAEVQDLFQQQANKELQNSQNAATPPESAETPVEDATEQEQPQPPHEEGEIVE